MAEAESNTERERGGEVDWSCGKEHWTVCGRT